MWLCLISAWRLAGIEYPEDKYRDVNQDLYGGRLDMLWRDTCFCWCFWFLDIPMSDLETSTSILVRAMDEAMNIQPRDMYWTVLGMMNNLWFRVTITRMNGILKFKHPTQPAMIPGGWMEEMKNGDDNLQERPENIMQIKSQKPLRISMKKLELNKTIGLDEFMSHKSEAQPWFAVAGEIYDGTDFLKDHPGGAYSIIAAGGRDVTEEFLAIRELI
jgi:nitrate reductase (NAD(P)H)